MIQWCVSSLILYIFSTCTERSDNPIMYAEVIQDLDVII
jgi:hypothetical protein